MPELPEVETVRRELEPVMREARIDRVLLRRPDLRTRFPRRFIARLEGTTVRAVNRRAKYLLVPVSSGETLVMHLGMSGSFRVEINAINANAISAIDAVDGDDATDAAPLPATLDRHDHVIFSLSTGASVVFNDPRRFGYMDLVRDADMPAHPTLGGLGPEPLSDGFDGDALARACAGRKTSLKVALLDQRVVAGLGNIYASEALLRRRTVAVAARVDHCDTGRRPARVGAPAGGGDQARAGAGDRARDRRPVPRRALPGLRSRGHPLPASRLRRRRPAAHPGRTLDVLLPGVPTLTVVSSR